MSERGSHVEQITQVAQPDPSEGETVHESFQERFYAVLVVGGLSLAAFGGSLIERQHTAPTASVAGIGFGLFMAGAVSVISGVQGFLHRNK